MAWYRRWPFLAGIALMVITNAVAMVGVIRNRSGSPESTLTLTQRELSVPYGFWRDDENSGLALELDWRTEPTQDNDSPGAGSWSGSDEVDWLTAAKLAELGIHVRQRALRNADSFSYSSSLPADVLLVLEMNGAAYQRRVARACRKIDDDCEREKDERSRLFVVDAGLDRDALRRKYPNRATHAIVQGQIAGSWVPTPTEPRLVGSVRGVSTSQIQVPVSMRGAIGVDSAMGQRQRDSTTRFHASVAFGQRLEPWILSLKPHAMK